MIRNALKTVDGVSRASIRLTPKKGYVIRAIDRDAWEAGDLFFRLLEAYHLEGGNDFPALAIAARRTVDALRHALPQPVFDAMREEIIPRTRRVLGDHPGILFHLLPSWQSIRRVLSPSAPSGR